MESLRLFERYKGGKDASLGLISLTMRENWALSPSPFGSQCICLILLRPLFNGQYRRVQRSG